MYSTCMTGYNISLIPRLQLGYEDISRKCSKYIPYSGKLSREKTFVNFSVLWLFAKVFSVKFGPWHSLAQHKQAICGSFLRENRFFTNLQKFSPLKVSCYTVHGRMSYHWQHTMSIHGWVQPRLSTLLAPAELLYLCCVTGRVSQ